jgi:small subunit ribosomal protein S8
MANIKKGDLVQVITGRTQARGGDRGKQGKVIEILTERNRVIVEGVNYVTKHSRVGKTLTLNLKYSADRHASIVGIKRVSKPGLRVYAKSTEIPKVLGGLGIAILSTSSGLLTDRQAEKKGVGGEVLAYVW